MHRVMWKPARARVTMHRLLQGHVTSSKQTKTGMATVCCTISLIFWWSGVFAEERFCKAKYQLGYTCCASWKRASQTNNYIFRSCLQSVTQKVLPEQSSDCPAGCAKYAHCPKTMTHQKDLLSRSCGPLQGQKTSSLLTSTKEKLQKFGDADYKIKAAWRILGRHRQNESRRKAFLTLVQVGKNREMIVSADKRTVDHYSKSGSWT